MVIIKLLSNTFMTLATTCTTYFYYQCLFIEGGNSLQTIVASIMTIMLWEKNIIFIFHRLIIHKVMQLIEQGW